MPANASAQYTAQMVESPSGPVIAPTDVLALTLTICDTATGIIINGVEQVNILNTGRGTVQTVTPPDNVPYTLLTVNLLPGDNDMSEVPGAARVQRSLIFDFTFISALTGAMAYGRAQRNYFVVALAGP